MSLTDILSLGALVVAVVSSILGGTVFINKRFEQARADQIENDKELRKEFMESMNSHKADVKSELKSAADSIQLIREQYASKNDVSAAESRLTTIVAEMKVDMRNSIQRIDDKLAPVPRLTAQVESLIDAVRSWDQNRP